MALGLRFADGTPAEVKRGKYQTRNNRLVEITGSHMQTGNTGGVPWSKLMWDGVLYQSDQKNIESHATWSSEGGYLHQEGVGNQFDLMTVISQEADPEPAAEPANEAVLENQILCAALVGRLSDVTEPEDENPMATLERIISERDEAQQKIVQLLATPVA